MTNSPVQALRELDHIYSLLAYAIVYKHWQPESIHWKNRRGYNIGAVLVHPNGQPVYAGLNCTTQCNNATQHGELRAISGYLSEHTAFDLNGFTVYATLEPCVMCAGMMIMTRVDRVVFGQHDAAYSKALERLALDTTQAGGYGPYPGAVRSEPSSLAFAGMLDAALNRFLATEPEKILAKFLASGEAEHIFRQAYECFITFKVQCPENERFLSGALEFLKNFNHEPAAPA